CSVPAGGRSCTSPRGAWSFASSDCFGRDLIRKPEATFRDHALLLRIAPSSVQAPFLPIRWPEGEGADRQVDRRSAGADHGSRNTTRARSGPRGAGYLGRKPHSVKPVLRTAASQFEPSRPMQGRVI